MSDLNDKIVAYIATKKVCGQLEAAKRAIAKKASQASLEHRRVCLEIHKSIGPLRANMLAINPQRSRYFEVEGSLCMDSTDPDAPPSYFVKTVLKTNGSYGKEDGWVNRRRIAGSLLPVSEDDPVYIKWKRRKVVKALEGNDCA